MLDLRIALDHEEANAMRIATTHRPIMGIGDAEIAAPSPLIPDLPTGHGLLTMVAT